MFATPSQSPPRGELVPPSRVDDETALARNSQVLRFGHCEVRFAHREILVDGAPRALQPRPFDLLAYLIENRERVVTSGELLAQVWPDTRAQPCSLPAAILRLRKALGDEHHEFIRTYQRVGYRFVAPREWAAPPQRGADRSTIAIPGAPTQSWERSALAVSHRPVPIRLGTGQPATPARSAPAGDMALTRGTRQIREV